MAKIEAYSNKQLEEIIFGLFLKLLIMKLETVLIVSI